MIILSPNHAASYLWLQGWIHTHMRTYQHKSDFKKPGVPHTLGLKTFSRVELSL